MDAHSRLKQLLEAFSNQEDQKGCDLLFFSPDVSYSLFDSLEKTAPFFFNYLETCFFENALQSIVLLENFFIYFKEPLLSPFDIALKNFFEKELKILLQKDLKQVMAPFIEILKKNSLALPENFIPPHKKLIYSHTSPPVFSPSSSWYLLYLEPLQNTPDFTPLKGKKGFLLLPHLSHLYQLVENPFLATFLKENECSLFFMDDFSKEIPLNEVNPLSPIQGSLPFALKKQEVALVQAFTERNPLSFFKISQEALFNEKETRYGKTRSLMHRLAFSYMTWRNPQIFSIKDAPYFFPDPDFVKVAFLRSRPSTSPSKLSSKLHCMHVVPQIVDQGHAPTRILKTLLEYRNKDLFDISILSTERLVFPPLEYPIPSIDSESSFIRGKNFLLKCEIEEIPVYLLDEAPLFKERLEQALSIFEEKKPDIVIFHGEDGLTNFLSATSSLPTSIFFQHDTPPKYPSFDSAFLSTLESFNLYTSFFPEKKGFFLPYSLEIEKTDVKVTRKELNIPENAFVFTTISNHLEARISMKFKGILISLMKKNPSVYFAPIGKIDDEKTFLEPFLKENLEKRVVLLGSKIAPAAYARCFNAYLNEFPFGGGLTLLDAMAASLPIVSFYDPLGPPQAQYIKYLLEEAWVIKGENEREYEDLAQKLILDPSFYTLFKTHTETRYKEVVNPKKYVLTFEQMVLSCHS